MTSPVKFISIQSVWATAKQVFINLSVVAFILLAVHLFSLDDGGLTCDPLFEVPDESGVTVGSGSVSLKHNPTHYDQLKEGSTFQGSFFVYEVSYRCF